jgi:hypothetical protein
VRWSKNPLQNAYNPSRVEVGIEEATDALAWARAP